MLSVGDVQLARKSARQLAELKAPLDLTLLPQRSLEPNIRLSVCISGGATFQMNTNPKARIYELKYKLKQDYDLDPVRQRWILGDQLPQDEQTLQECGVDGDGYTAHLHVLPVRAALPPVDDAEYRRRKLDELPDPRQPVPEARRPLPESQPPVPESSRPVPEPPRAVPEPPRPVRERPRPVPELTQALTWVCPHCTFENKLLMPGCEGCNADRPDTVIIPQGYKPRPEEMHLPDARRLMGVEDEVQEDIELALQTSLMES